MNRRGSALIFMFLFITFISSLLILFLRNSMLFYTFSLDRISHAQQRFALEGLAHYGMAYSSAHQKNLTNDTTLNYDTWPLSKGRYQGSILIIPRKKRQYRLRARLFQEKALLGEIIAEYELSKKGILISEWRAT